MECKVAVNVAIGRTIELDLYQVETYPTSNTSTQISRDSSLLKAQYISILLTALVVMCPFQCILGGCLAGAADDVSVCCSCEMPADDAGDSIPSAPEGCDCGGCFCRGALPANDISDDMIAAELVSFLTFWVKLDVVPVVAPPAQVESRSFLIPVDASAVEVRAALSCWLI